MYELMQQFPDATEWYEVVKTVAVRLNGQQYRIEVIRRFDRRLQSTYDALLWRAAGEDGPLEPYDYLVRDTGFPWVSQDTAEGALHAALQHLLGRAKT